MLSNFKQIKICERIATKCIQRHFAMLSASEEFPLSISISPKKAVISPIAVQKSTLDNGIKVISYDKGNSKMASVQIAILSGSQTESYNQKGSAHLSSILPFSGTIKFTALKLARILEDAGVIVKSFSDREKIVFQISSLPEKLDVALLHMGETIQRPFRPAFMAKEAKDIAVVAYEKLASSPHLQLKEYLFEAGYGEMTPLGGSVYADNIEKLDEKDSIQYAVDNFVLENVVISGSGVDHDHLKQLVKVSFADLKKGKAVKASSSWVGGDVRIRKDLDGVSHVGIGFPIKESNVYANQILYMSLLKRLAPKLKSSHSSFFEPSSDGGLYGFIASGDAAESGEFIRDVVSALKSIVKETPSIDAFKKKLKLDHSLSMDTGDAAILTKDISSLEKVSSKDISLAASIALSCNPAYAVLGRTFGTLSFPSVLQLLK